MVATPVALGWGAWLQYILQTGLINLQGVTVVVTHPILPKTDLVGAPVSRTGIFI